MSLPHNAYLQAEVLSASPARLVEILYDLGISSIESAKLCMREGDMIGRGRFVTKAFEVLVELSNSLNFESSPEFSSNYARLYDYCQRRLLQAHSEQSEGMLSEVQSLLIDLREAWQPVMVATTPRCLSDEEVAAERELASEPRFSFVG